MLIGIIGLPQCGKSTLFAAISGSQGDGETRIPPRSDQRIATLLVPDDRIGLLEGIYRPKKTTLAKIPYMLPGRGQGDTETGFDEKAWSRVRICDGFLHVIRRFEVPGAAPPSPETGFRRLEDEMIWSDLLVVEKRLERIELDRKRGKRPEGDELGLLPSSRRVLDSGKPLRSIPELATHPALRGFAFLSAKPELLILNNDDEDESLSEWELGPEDPDFMVVRCRLERDIASMAPEEADEFREAYHIRESVLDRVIKASYKLLNRISFFTVLSHEVRAWTVEAGTRAIGAAGAVHSDMEKGFIRAETLSYDDLKAFGSFQEAKKAGAVRLEGKEYEVKDGDILNFRFNI